MPVKDTSMDTQPNPAPSGESETFSRVSHVAEQIERVSQPFRRVQQEIARVLVGQNELMHRMLVALLANGHVLIEGLPGLAKTTAVACLAKAFDTGFQRIQFTPDLLPADLLGTQVYRPQHHDFVVQKGPIFSNFVLADEINRAPAKVQSALLEAMQERQVTIGAETFRLDEPFLVMATQNPLEHAGTYPLPEAQLDRFMLKVTVAYPDRDEEIEIVSRMGRTSPYLEIEPVLQPADVLAARRMIDDIYLDDRVRDYLVDLVLSTRNPHAYGLSLDGVVQHGASPRASIFLALSAKAAAFLEGRGYVTPYDVKVMARDVLRHRIILSYAAEAEGRRVDDVIQTLLDQLPVP